MEHLAVAFTLTLHTIKMAVYAGIAYVLFFDIIKI